VAVPLSTGLGMRLVACSLAPTVKVIFFKQQISVQLPISTDNLALPVFAAVRRAAAWLLLSDG